jgi:hypothetical protein
MQVLEVGILVGTMIFRMIENTNQQAFSTVGEHNLIVYSDSK